METADMIAIHYSKRQESVITLAQTTERFPTEHFLWLPGPEQCKLIHFGVKSVFVKTFLQKTDGENWLEKSDGKNWLEKSGDHFAFRMVGFEPLHAAPFNWITGGLLQNRWALQPKLCQFHNGANLSQTIH